MTIYLDIVLLENLILNYILLVATAVICKARIRTLKLLFSSFLGSIYALIYYVFNLNFLISILAKLILSICMILIAFKEKTIKSLMKKILAFYFVSFMFGGIAFYIMSKNNINSIFSRVGKSLINIKVSIKSGIIGCLFIWIGSKIWNDKFIYKNMTCELKIISEGRSKKIRTLIDSGNLLIDPFSKRPVIVVSKQSLYEIIPDEILTNLEEITNHNISSKRLKRVRAIPFKSIGNDNGIIIGYKVDKIIIMFEQEEKEVDNVIIGIYEKKISPKNEYDGLIGLNLLQ